MKITQKKQNHISLSVVIKRIAMAAMLLALSTSMMYAQKKGNAKTKKIVKTDSTKGFETLLWGDTVEQVKEKGYDIEHVALENKAKKGISEESELYNFNNKDYRGKMVFLNDKLYHIILYPLKDGDKFSIPEIQKKFGEHPCYEGTLYTDAKTEGRSYPDFDKISFASIFYNNEFIGLCDWQYFKDHHDSGRGFSGKKAFKEIEKEKALAAEKAKKAVEIDTRAKEIAKGYIYHGTSEETQNAKLFSAGALEEGHAYYIPMYMAGSRGTTGAAIASIFETPKYHIVEYINQKVRGEVVTAGQTIVGNLPISVVVAGGNAPAYIPVIIGLIE